MCRLDDSIIGALTSPDRSCYRYSSRLRKHWWDSLLMNYVEN